MSISWLKVCPLTAVWITFAERHETYTDEKGENVMTIQECYESFGGDFEDVRQRIPKDELIQRFALKFLDDKSYENLLAGLKNDDMDQAFRAAHSLKGVSQNLSFKNLGISASELTEALRHWETEPVDKAHCEELLKQVTADYEAVVAAVKQL